MTRGGSGVDQSKKTRICVITKRRTFVPFFSGACDWRSTLKRPICKLCIWSLQILSISKKSCIAKESICLQKSARNSRFASNKHTYVFVFNRIRFLHRWHTHRKRKRRGSAQPVLAKAASAAAELGAASSGEGAVRRRGPRRRCLLDSAHRSAAQNQCGGLSGLILNVCYT